MQSKHRCANNFLSLFPCQWLKSIYAHFFYFICSFVRLILNFCAGLKKIITNKGYEGEVRLLSDPCSPTSSTRCLDNCERCVDQGNDDSNKDILSNYSTSLLINKYQEFKHDSKFSILLSTEWQTVKGKFFMVNGANVSCACSKSPMGFSPHCHIGDGCVDVILVRHTSLINNLRMLLRLSSRKKTLVIHFYNQTLSTTSTLKLVCLYLFVWSRITW